MLEELKYKIYEKEMEHQEIMQEARKHYKNALNEIRKGFDAIIRFDLEHRKI